MHASAHHGAVLVPQVRGVRPNPQKLHAKVLDHDNGCYTVTYKPEVSGQLEISISCDGIAISGSPFTADAVTLTSQPLHSRSSRHILSASMHVLTTAPSPPHR